jgi:hypothetical protein
LIPSFFLSNITTPIRDNIIYLLLHQNFIVISYESNLITEFPKIYNKILEYNIIEIEDFIDFDDKSQTLETSKFFIY